ncbi:MAG: mechanosensitive ion channel [Pseudobdellovibrionaceae bacterium]|nr:mechanosensitive ion channel [Bdellovibrionales bacterium]USN47978.1 MAG: mechanosensitive ion channel [Pseudobdellovibrionaceae bacterium]
MDYLHHLASWTSQFHWLPDFWDFNIATIDGKPITLGTVLTGIVLLILGYFLCRQLSRWFGRRVLSRLDIDESLKHTLQTIIFYVLLIILTLFVLRLLNVPVTIFTVLGGALAIGVGFGSQNIVNNFISGLIIMIERPVRVGDFIQLESLGGRVEHIGARSTRIKSLDNTHIVVPNSSFLEKNVLNWTLSDDLVRIKVAVGVAYGSDTERVENFLKQAAGEEDAILKYPEPIVVFADFGDNSLNFEVYFWTHLTDMMNIKLLQSRLRFRIDHIFREGGVVIAFPQRDVHLDTLRPLQVEVVQPTSKH